MSRTPDVRFWASVGSPRQQDFHDWQGMLRSETPVLHDFALFAVFTVEERQRMRILLLSIAASVVLTAQSPLVLRYVNTSDPKAMSELATTVRSVAGIPNVAADPTAQTFTVYDAAQWQQKLAAWLFEKLDRPRLASPPPTDEFSAGAQADPAVCVLYPAAAKSLQEIQEFSTVVRSLLEIRRAFVYSPSGAVVLRGTPEEIAAAKWLAAQMDTASGPDTATLSGAKEPVMRVFRLKHTLSIQEFQDHTTNMRRQTRIRRVFTYNAPRIVAARGTVEEIAAAEKVLRDQGVL